MSDIKFISWIRDKAPTVKIAFAAATLGAILSAVGFLRESSQSSQISRVAQFGREREKPARSLFEREFIERLLEEGEKALAVGRKKDASRIADALVFFDSAEFAKSIVRRSKE